MDPRIWQLCVWRRLPRAPGICPPPARPPWQPPTFQSLLLTSVPSRLSQVAGWSHPSWERAQTAALDKTQTAGPGQ